MRTRHLQAAALFVLSVLGSSVVLGSSGWGSLGSAIGGGNSQRDREVYEQRLAENAGIQAAIASAESARMNAEFAAELNVAWQSLGMTPEDANAMTLGFELQLTAVATKAAVKRNGWRWGVQKAIEFRDNLDTYKANETLLVALRLFYAERAAQQASVEQAPTRAADPPDGRARASAAAGLYSCTIGQVVGEETGSRMYEAECPSGPRRVECDDSSCRLY